VVDIVNGICLHGFCTHMVNGCVSHVCYFSVMVLCYTPTLLSTSFLYMLIIKARSYCTVTELAVDCPVQFMCDVMSDVNAGGRHALQTSSMRTTCTAGTAHSTGCSATLDFICSTRRVTTRCVCKSLSCSRVFTSSRMSEIPDHVCTRCSRQPTTVSSF